MFSLAAISTHFEFFGFSLAAISTHFEFFGFSLAAISTHFEFFGFFLGNSEEFMPHRLAGITHETFEVTPEGIYRSIWISFNALLSSVFYFCGCELLAFFFKVSTHYPGKCI